MEKSFFNGRAIKMKKKTSSNEEKGYEEVIKEGRKKLNIISKTIKASKYLP